MKKVFIFAVTFLVGAYISGHILVSETESLNYTVFWKSSIWADETEKTLKQGDYVLFKFAEGVHYVKRIACLPNQSLQKLEGDWFCASRRIKNGVTITHGSSGKKLRQFDFYGFIPEDQYFVVGDSDNSFDSRYWGFVDAENILYTLTPLW